MMNTVQVLSRSYEFNRSRTLALLESIEKLGQPQAALSWRAGPGRAHIGWQLMHIAITEEIFATERLAPQRPPMWVDLWPRFRGGSTPDDNVPSVALIREVLKGSRERLSETLSGYDESRLGEIPASLKARNLTVLDALHIIGWHEGHHQGQAHFTFNLFKASNP